MLTDPLTTDAQDANYDESKIPAYTLPDPLTFNDGSTVASSDDWETRRSEIVQLFKDHVFGAMPARSPETQRVVFKIFSESSIAFRVDPDDLESELVEAKLKEFDIVLGVDGSGKEHRIRMLLVLPGNDTTNTPVFLGYNFQGNHTVHSSKKISLSKVWNRDRECATALESTRGSKSSRWPLGLIVSKGYGVATVYYGDVDPDFDDEFQNGVHPLYPELQGREDNWTSIGAWAWGLSRMVDFFESIPDVDGSRVAVFGHSRLGKTSLWAGATDNRFRVVISNNSGCGGAALARRQIGETVKRINTVFPHWFCLQHKSYNDSVHEMPVDHHMLLAAIAPRPVYVASAQGDQWADPKGEFLAAFHASPVYRMLGLKGLGIAIDTDSENVESVQAPKMPVLGKRIGDRVGYHIREGKHDITRYDWEQFLSFSSRFLR